MIEAALQKMIASAIEPLTEKIQSLEGLVRGFLKNEERKMLTVAEAAVFLKIEEDSLSKALRQKRIDGVKIGRRYYIDYQYIKNKIKQ